MARLHDIVFDCRHPASLARFWAATLDRYEVAPYDEVELDRLRAAGIDSAEEDPTVLVEPDHAGPRLWFQRVPETKTGKNRVHLDLLVDDLDTEVDRLVALGATVLSDQRAAEGTRVVLSDPEGNELCIEGAAPTA